MRGFTLIELIITSAIFSTLLAVAIPNLINFSDSHQSRSSVIQLHKVFTGARNIALNNNQKITVCPQLNDECNNDWKNPISVFNDTNNNEKIDDDETLFLTASNESSSGSWLIRNDTTKSIKFNERGHAFGSATTLLYCPTSKKYQYARQLIISFQGRIRSDNYLTQGGTPFASLGDFNCPP